MIKQETSQIYSEENISSFIAEERKKSILQIENETKDLFEINTELAKIVKSQQESIDDIEDHIESVIIEQDKASECLEDRSNYEDRKRKTWFAVGLGAATALIVTALAIRSKD